MTDTLGLAEAAMQLKIPYQDAHRLLLVGRLSGQKRGGRWFVSRDSLAQLMAERQGQARAPAAS